MSKRHLQPLRNNCRQLVLVVLGFVLCISLLESKGFVIWAQRLEVGPMQQRVLRAMEALDQAWSAVAGPVTEIRPNALDYLSERGWSDLPVRNHGQGDDAGAGEADQGNNTRHLFNRDHPGGAEQGQEQEVNNADAVSGRDGAASNPENHSGGADGTAQTGAQSSTEGGAVTQESGGEEEGAAENQAGAPEPLPQVVSNGLPVVQPDVDGRLAPLPYVEPGLPRKIALAGDSMMAVGLGAQLQRELSAHKDNVTVFRAYRSATGLGRPDVFNWQREYPAMAGDRKPDVVIVAIGANDTQSFEVNRRVLTIGSDAWREVYAQRLTDYLNMLTQDGAVVLWIKLPPMRPNKYNENIKIVNEVAHAVVMQNPRAIWWDVSSRFVNEQGRFQEFATLTQGGRPVRIRQADGIHLSDEGARLLTADIMAWLNPNTPPAPPVLPESQADMPPEELQPVAAVPVPGTAEGGAVAGAPAN